MHFHLTVFIILCYIAYTKEITDVYPNYISKEYGFFKRGYQTLRGWIIRMWPFALTLMSISFP
jgi:hypothetical protein